MYVNGKMSSIKSIPGMGRGVIKKNDRRVKFSNDVHDVLLEFI
jgi:hypothetical protein